MQFFPSGYPFAYRDLTDVVVRYYVGESVLWLYDELLVFF